MPTRTVVVGLDCAEPSLMFDRWAAEMPNLRALRERGIWGKLRSTTPPITVPAWSCMMSGADPGALGVYGFRNRRAHSYEMDVATSRDVRIPRVWDYLSRAKKRVVVQSVPQTYPPSAVNGSMVSCFLTPSAQSPYTHPPELRDDLRAKFGDYRMDVENFRSDDKERLLRDIHAMTKQHFDMALYLLSRERPDFFMMVEMGVDRFHHAFWKYVVPEHPRHPAANPWVDAGREYYATIDRRLGEVIDAAGDANVLVVSDHGARSMLGGVCVNEWLIREGYLALAQTPTRPTRFGQLPVDWSHTEAWGEGGYYARLFLNVRGREPEGTLAPERVEEVRSTIARKIEAMAGPDGRPLGNVVYRPDQIYREVRGVPPDLLVFFGNLAWRSVGSVGYGGEIFTTENDTGPDDANHDWNGIFVAAGPGFAGRRGEVEGYELRDVAPTVMRLFEMEVPAGMGGTPRA